jgi:hypothetical protein
MGGFLGLGGSSAKTDRKTQLAGFSDLNNIFNFGLNTSKSLLPSGTATTATGLGDIKTGLSTLGNAGDYWKRLVSGDRTSMMQAVAPEANTARAESDAARRGAAAAGTARGGGTGAGGQTATTDLMSKVDNLLFGVRPQAAKEEAAVGAEEGRLGGMESEIGLQQVQAALSAMGLSGNAAAALTSLAGSSRKTSYDINRQTQQDVVSAIGQLLSFA